MVDIETKDGVSTGQPDGLVRSVVTGNIGSSNYSRNVRTVSKNFRDFFLKVMAKFIGKQIT